MYLQTDFKYKSLFTILCAIGTVFAGNKKSYSFFYNALFKCRTVTYYADKFKIIASLEKKR